MSKPFTVPLYDPASDQSYTLHIQQDTSGALVGHLREVITTGLPPERHPVVLSIHFGALSGADPDAVYQPLRLLLQSWARALDNELNAGANTPSPS